MKEIISLTTSRRRAALVGLSAVAILLSRGFVTIPPGELLSFGGQKFQVEINTLYWLLLIFLIYQIANFWWAIANDIGVFKTNIKPTIQGIKTALDQIFDRQKRILDQRNELGEFIDGMAPEPIRKYLDNSAALVKSLEATMRQYRRRLFIFNKSWFLRIYVWELGLPMLLAAYAVIGVIHVL